MRNRTSGIFNGGQIGIHCVDPQAPELSLGFRRVNLHRVIPNHPIHGIQGMAAQKPQD